MEWGLRLQDFVWDQVLEASVNLNLTLYGDQRRILGRVRSYNTVCKPPPTPPHSLQDWRRARRALEDDPANFAWSSEDSDKEHTGKLPPRGSRAMSLCMLNV